MRGRWMPSSLRRSDVPSEAVMKSTPTDLHRRFHLLKSSGSQILENFLQDF